MDDSEAEKEPLKLHWFEIYFIPPGGGVDDLTTKCIVSETHESAKLAALQRIPMRKFYRARQREEL